MIEKIMQDIDKSYSQFHVVSICKKRLLENGFKELKLDEDFKITSGKYFVIRNDSSIIAFTFNKNVDINKGFRIFASHTDSPTFRIKPNPEVDSLNIRRLNLEVYGGPIINTWYDRPLSLAGRVVLKSKETFNPKSVVFNIDKNLLTIPNLAIHQNREVNNGVAVDKQAHTLPILDVFEDSSKNLLDVIHENLGLEVKKTDILDYDLYLYLREKSTLIGQNQNLLSSPRIDNLASLYTSLYALIESDLQSSINVLVGFDNEEIGSHTKQGADSNFLLNTLERIVLSLGFERKDFLRVLNKSYIISADATHAVHPAFVNKSDITNLPKINKGVCIKVNSNFSYTTDAYSSSILKQIVADKVNLQYFVNNSNERGGSTIGPISSSHVDINSIDLGIPMLAMHSSRELCGTSDLLDLHEIAKCLFKGK